MKKVVVSKKLFLGSCISLLSLLSSGVAGAAEVNAGHAIEEVEVISVRDRLNQAGLLKDVIQKTELVSDISIESKNAINLSEAIESSAGVRVSNECSMCGVKRVMMNGLRGEHTTILTDGQPLHTMMSGFYAIDAVATTGIQSIEIARGAGASMIAPEAIGGTINIITKEADENGVNLDISKGNAGNSKLAFVGFAVSEDEKTRVTAIGQYDTRDQFDTDNNGVSENPYMSNRTHIVRISHDLSAKDNVIFRLGQIESEVFGGPVLGDTVGSIGQALSSFDGFDNASNQLFEGDDVRNRYIGKAWETTEWVKTERQEFSLSWLRELDSDLSMTLLANRSEHVQDSFYEGLDYYAEDDLSHLDARFNWLLNDSHVFTFGTDYRLEEMRSQSIAGAAQANYQNDSFDYQVIGVYLQDAWLVSDSLDISMALRIDQVSADFTDPSKPGTEIEETILSPRLDMRYMHNDSWTSRLAMGRGYRAPLSFFESDHGILGDKGFIINVSDLERSKSANYSLSYESDVLTATGSLSYTAVDNLAVLGEHASGAVEMFQLDETGEVAAADITLGWNIQDNLIFNATLEGFNYSPEFESSYAIAPVEKRLSFDIDYDVNGWDLMFAATWIGERNLSKYNYDGENILASGIKKTTIAPEYWSFNVNASYELTPSLTLYTSVTNLLDYTQAADEDSPLTYSDGAYDVTYIFGPLRGREVQFGFRLKL